VAEATPFQNGFESKRLPGSKRRLDAKRLLGLMQNGCGSEAR
jgi:hypothetical protein